MFGKYDTKTAPFTRVYIARLMLWHQRGLTAESTQEEQAIYAY